MRRILFQGLVPAAVALASLGVSAQGRPPGSHSVDRFAVELYRQISRDPGNLVFSPFSTAHGLGMARVGARGETGAQIDRVLSLAADFAQRQGTLAAELAPPLVRDWDEHGNPTEIPAYRLEIANALWGQTGFSFLDPFLEVLRTVYHAPLERIDFRAGDLARATINGWVAERTHGRVEDIVPPGQPPSDSRLVLVNALYFKADWADRFTPGATAEADWHGSGEAPRRVPLMHRTDDFGYYESTAVQVVELPYRGAACSLLIVLPRRPDGLAEVERSLTAERLAGWLQGLQTRRLDLRIPRFKFTSSFDLGDTLAAMGMPLAFSESQADFGAITAAEPIVIGAVLHKAFIGVDEHGTEAAAATAVVMPAGATMAREAPIPFVADHPFLFVIRHRASGTILFFGRLSVP